MPFRHVDTSASGPRILRSSTTYSIFLGSDFSLRALMAATISLKPLGAIWRNALWRMPSLATWMPHCCSNDALAYSSSLRGSDGPGALRGEFDQLGLDSIELLMPVAWHKENPAQKRGISKRRSVQREL
jgi:hypothetical protein